ncbi:HD-GYP domain-containing protein [Marinobacter caseinilyticus]|uniref:HD-GYP domain-containing protein n=1 Tax=Marinobacter caseinilyticus TaxID=2692195 RepID=UPI00140A8F6F|nr:HD-GYP domain-containing protein [Marinobacter caseinilyticus]
MFKAEQTKAVKLPVDNLDFGMYVSKLDRPWLQSPFLIQGFYIRDESELRKLQEICDYVWVDTSTIPAGFIQTIPSPVPHAEASDEVQIARQGGSVPGREKSERYAIEQTLENELPKAAASMGYFSQMVTETFDSLVDGKNLDLGKIRKATRPMIDSMIANPDAMIWLARMKSRNDYVFKHALCVSVWVVALGRQLGLPKQELTDLSIAGLLSDIGKLWVDDAILNKSASLTREEREAAHEHVSLGLSALDKASAGSIPRNIREAILSHHERHGGQGYPSQLTGNSIPLYARIVGIADFYDAVTSKRVYAEAISSGEALKQLYASRNIEFQAELIEEFIQAIGIYPAGSVVELSDNSTAIVVAAGRAHRLRPRVIIVFDADGHRNRNPVIVDLAKPREDGESNLEIIKSIPANNQQYDFDDFYI